MDFGPTKTSGAVIKEGAFARTYFRDIYSVLLESGTKSYGKNLITWKILIRSFIAQVIMMSVSINMVLNAKHC